MTEIAYPPHWAYIQITRVFAEIEDWILWNKNKKQLLPMYNSAIIRFYDFFISNKNVDRVTFQECVAKFLAVYVDYIDVPNEFVYCWLQRYKAYKMSLIMEKFILFKFIGFIKFNRTIKDELVQKIWLFHLECHGGREHLELFDEPLYKTICKQIDRIKTHAHRISRIPNCFFWFHYMNRIYCEKSGIMELPKNQRIWELFETTIYYKKLKKFAEDKIKRNEYNGTDVDDNEFVEKCRIVAENNLLHVGDEDDEMEFSEMGWMFL